MTENPHKRRFNWINRWWWRPAKSSHSRKVSDAAYGGRDVTADRDENYDTVSEFIRITETMDQSLNASDRLKSQPRDHGRDGRQPLKAQAMYGKVKRLGLAFFIVGILTYLFVPPVWRLKTGPISIVRWPKSGQMVIEVGPGLKSWTPVSAVSRHVLNAIIVAEDGKFYVHPGLDFEEIIKSFETNLEKRRYARGGSTITQQVVKMAFLSGEKTLIRKAREAAGALLLECVLTKDEILAWYINMAEFGDGVFGLRKASWHYFQTKPELLTIQNGANLAIVLPSPNSWSKGLRQRQLTPFGHKRYATIISQLRAGGYITDALKDVALATGDFGRPIRGWVPGPEAFPEEEDLDEEEQGASKGYETPRPDTLSNSPTPSPVAAVEAVVPVQTPAPPPVGLENSVDDDSPTPDPPDANPESDE